MTSSSLTRRRSERARKGELQARHAALRSLRGVRVLQKRSSAPRACWSPSSPSSRAAQRRGCHRNDPVLASSAAKGRLTVLRSGQLHLLLIQLVALRQQRRALCSVSPRQRCQRMSKASRAAESTHHDAHDGCAGEADVVLLLVLQRVAQAAARYRVRYARATSQSSHLHNRIAQCKALRMCALLLPRISARA
jgi:hypothetical protein